MNKLCIGCVCEGSFICPIDCKGHEDVENQVEEEEHEKCRKMAKMNEKRRKA